MKYIEKSGILSSVFSLLLLFVANIVQSQEIAPVPVDPAVKSGQLPNGMKWYVATNPDAQGTADFALVQMTGTGTIQSVGGETIKAYAQESLMSQPLLTAPSVQDFFINKGSVPGPEGFAQVQDNATIFRFGNVNLKLSDTVLDSTLLVMMNMAGRQYRSDDLLLKKWYTPADQALVVAGDINADAVVEKLRMLSYMIPASTPVQRTGYVWQDVPGVKVNMSASKEQGIARVAASWRLERTPRELMNTIQPAIQEKYMTMAGLVAEERILKHFKEMGLPVASVESRYVGGAGTLGDGGFSIEVALASDKAAEAVSAIASVISSIDAFGVSAVESDKAATEFADMAAGDAGHTSLGNGAYISRCISAFIYNTPLSSRKDIIKFYSSRDLSAETEGTLLHSVASASLDGDRNLTLKYASDSLVLSEDSLKAIFNHAWKEAAVNSPATQQLIPIPYLPMPEIKVKVQSAKKEPLSGGTVWTLSNGMKIYVKNMPTEDGQVHYSLSLHGGTGDIEGLGNDDGGYLSDYLDHCTVGGVPAKIFKDVIRSHGMTLSCEVGHSAAKFSGCVPADGMDYLLRALLALMNERKTDGSAWRYYLEGEPLRQAANTASGTGICLTEDFAGKADEFFRTLSENINNGIFVLVGNIDEKQLKNALMAYAGGFRTTDKTFRRTGTGSRNFTGMEGYRRQGSERSVNVALTAPMALTAENYYTAAVTSLVLRRHFAQELAGKGMRVNVTYECRRFPQESVLMRVLVSEAAVDGFASGTTGYTMGAALSTMRKVFADLSAVSVDEKILATYRYRLERHLAREKSNPGYWVDALNLRYLDGKDFTTGAEARIRSINETNVRKMLSALDSNSKIEYVITGK